MSSKESQAVVKCPICSQEMPERDINIHLDNGCSDTPLASSSKPPKPRPSQNLGKTLKTSATAKTNTPLHPLFQKPDPLSPTTPTQPKKRNAEEAVHPISTPASGPSKRQKISTNVFQAAPLAERLRPTLLTEYVGQEHLTETGSMLMNALTNGSLGSMIFWGPPGCGKTTLARLIAKQSGSIFKELSATIVGINEVRPIFEEAKNSLRLTGRKTILFLDEVHRFNKSQQDVFLPFLEQGHIQLIGATTENPSFKLTGALLSRCRVFVLERLSDANIEEIIRKAIIRLSPAVEDEPSSPNSSPQRPLTPVSSQLRFSSPPPFSDTLFPAYPHLTAPVLSSMISLSTGDARTALSLLDLVLSASKTTPESNLIENLRRSVSSSYDRSGDSRYDMISALHKSVRGSNVDAAMYWLARMLSGGEDPLYVARRMVVCASEDVGLADKHALPLAMAALQACQVIGMPECRINLAHIVAYLAEAPKSIRAYEAFNRAEIAAKSDLTLPVPLVMRNAPTSLMKDLGYAEGYRYNPDYIHPVHQTYVPLPIEGQRFMRQPGDNTGKIWDEEALKDWERERNDGNEWEGRCR